MEAKLVSTEVEIQCEYDEVDSEGAYYYSSIHSEHKVNNRAFQSSRI